MNIIKKPIKMKSGMKLYKENISIDDFILFINSLERDNKKPILNNQIYTNIRLMSLGNNIRDYAFTTTDIDKLNKDYILLNPVKGLYKNSAIFKNNLDIYTYPKHKRFIVDVDGLVIDGNGRYRYEKLFTEEDKLKYIDFVKREGFEYIVE